MWYTIETKNIVSLPASLCARVLGIIVYSKLVFFKRVSYGYQEKE